MTRPKGRKVADPMLPGKTSKHNHQVTVPETDTGRRGEKPKALGETLVKELGKLPP